MRDYCKKRNVSYRDFLLWASTCEVSSGIVEIERKKKRLQKEKSVQGVVRSSPSLSLCEAKPEFYPLHITFDGCNNVVESDAVSSSLTGHVDSSPVGNQSNLRGVRIIFPNGVKISVREADSSGIFSLVYGK